tara:strand:+ start:1222 stop:1917 length:696 start_codon:yes stop_codon:yes gene_type:complete
VLLQTKNLNSFYGDFQALYNISIELMPGEIIAIIGANGAGKSTLMRSITGLVSKTENEILFKGNILNNLSPDKIVKRGISMVPEGRKLFPSLTVEENLLIGSNVSRKGKWNLKSIYDLFPDLYDKRNISSNLLSGGQQQMNAIGRSLMANPELILFDEISLGLAPIIIKTIYKNLPKVIDEGMSAIVVEQDISKALEISNRVYCLQEGKISLEGDSKKITRDQISKAYFGM